MLLFTLLTHIPDILTIDYDRNYTMKIDRDDMLELTRRMSVARNCFSRIAGAYMDEDGFVDESFNTHFLKLTKSEQEKNIKIAKAIPFAKPEDELVNIDMKPQMRSKDSLWQLLMALRECELKNDALLYNLYEYIGERYDPGYPYGIYVFYGNYDVPVKCADNESQWESEEVYRFMICAISPLHDDYEMGTPQAGFLFPAFANRSTDVTSINVFNDPGLF